jgi:glycosyltransferase involved in cell wall biosynthesis
MLHPSISLVIPCYNEQDRIANMWLGISNFIKVWTGDFEIIIVNDGSNDATEKLILSDAIYISLLPEKKILYVLQENLGKGAALQNGVKNASKDFILTLDADMATEPIEILQWLQISDKIFSNNTITIASRTLPESKLVLISGRRKTGNIFNYLVRLKTGLDLKDTQCGFKLYPNAIAKKLFNSLQTVGWAHDVEILQKAKMENYSILEMPILWNEKNASKINVVRDGIKMLWDVMRLK